MSELAIHVENLSKRYRIGLAQRRQDTLRDALAAGLRSVEERFRHNHKGGSNDSLEDSIWALRDVSFAVEWGEVIGIIGRNGAGKSTLLKILSRVTKPTSGHARVNGRMGSLLEVGTGFHDELTGRENIYLSGAILGMKKIEIERKFEEIVEFSGVEKFIDTPIKRYSSGMKVRLGFAVAAHLEPEILVVDEVLAVGDAGFQKKCLGKMGDVSKEGRTVLLVSHNMVAIQNLCQRTIWLDQGEKVMEGQTSQVVTKYLTQAFSNRTQQMWRDKMTAPGNDIVRLHKVCARPSTGLPSDPITMDTPLLVEVEYWNLVPGVHLSITLHFYTEQGIVAFTTGSVETDRKFHEKPMQVGLFRSVCHVPENLLNSGLYQAQVLVVKNSDRVIYHHEDALSFEILEQEKRPGTWYGKEPGSVHPILKWNTVHLDGQEM